LQELHKLIDKLHHCLPPLHAQDPSVNAALTIPFRQRIQNEGVASLRRARI